LAISAGGLAQRRRPAAVAAAKRPLLAERPCAACGWGRRGRATAAAAALQRRQGVVPAAGRLGAAPRPGAAKAGGAVVMSAAAGRLVLGALATAPCAREPGGITILGSVHVD
jgi:hypothetical protein